MTSDIQFNDDIERLNSEDQVKNVFRAARDQALHLIDITLKDYKEKRTLGMFLIQILQVLILYLKGCISICKLISVLLVQYTPSLPNPPPPNMKRKAFVIENPMRTIGNYIHAFSELRVKYSTFDFSISVGYL